MYKKNKCDVVKKNDLMFKKRENLKQQVNGDVRKRGRRCVWEVDR